MRTAAVSGQVQPKEASIRGQIDTSRLSPREAAAVELAERMAFDPHSVDDPFFAHLKSHFSDDQIVDLVFACSIFNWGNKFNITMRLDTAPESAYATGLTYRTAAPPGR